MALLSATAPAKTRFSLFSHEEAQHPHPHALSAAVRGEGQYRGPIQIQSNALAALEAIDMSVAEEVMREGCVTGDRINGLVDGISGSWRRDV
uniref:Uncharacterized protein n=1 Tax=Oryza barthii TaxID=65489 RepID=A0A0D3FWF9_9ORYZ